MPDVRYTTPIFLNLQLYSIIHTIQEYCQFIVAYNSIFFCPPIEPKPKTFSHTRLSYKNFNRTQDATAKESQGTLLFQRWSNSWTLRKDRLLPHLTGLKPARAPPTKCYLQESLHITRARQQFCVRVDKMCVLSPWQTNLARRVPQWLQQPWSEHSACPPTDTENNDC